MSGALRIVVCVRPPDGEQLEPTLGSLDLRAVEYGISLARSNGSASRVIAVAAGGDACQELLRECYARGVDEVVHIHAETPEADGLIVASRLAASVRELAPDLVLCGDRSDAGMHGIVPREIARLIGVPFVGSVMELTIEGDGATPEVRAVQRLERGDRWAWGCTLPLVCGVERDICSPRYLAVRRRKRAATVSPASSVRPPEGSGPQAAHGLLVVEERRPPRIRPKKSKVATAAMSAADRMKLLRGGGRTPAPAGDPDDAPKRVVGDPESAAKEIIRLLEKNELIRG